MAGANAKARMYSSCNRACIWLPLDVSHMRTYLSIPPEASMVASAVNASAFTVPSCDS